MSGTGTIYVTNNGAALAASGAITGPQAFILEAGASVTTLSGANTFTGGTTLQGGTLSVMGGAALTRVR